MKLPSSRAGGKRAPMAEINVTPFVDVMLVLLIIFMVTAPLLTSGVPINLPDSRAKALEQDREPIQIAIDAAGKIYIDNVETPTALLPERLARIAGEAPMGPDGAAQPAQIVLRADRGLNYGRVMTVMGELNRAGLNRVSLMTVGSEARP